MNIHRAWFRAQSSSVLDNYQGTGVELTFYVKMSHVTCTVQSFAGTAKPRTDQIGKKVTPTYVSNIKSLTQKKPKAKRRRGMRSAKASRAGNNGAVKHVGLDLVIIESMKSIVSAIGADTAKSLIDLLS